MISVMRKMQRIVCTLLHYFTPACKTGVIFFAFFRRARASARRARSARHARPLRARLALALARLKNAKNSVCSAGYISHNQYTVHMYAQQATVKRGERWKLCRNVPCPGSMIFHWIPFSVWRCQLSGCWWFLLAGLDCVRPPANTLGTNSQAHPDWWWV